MICDTIVVVFVMIVIGGDGNVAVLFVALNLSAVAIYTVTVCAVELKYCCNIHSNGLRPKTVQFRLSNQRTLMFHATFDSLFTNPTILSRNPGNLATREES